MRVYVPEVGFIGWRGFRSVITLMWQGRYEGTWDLPGLRAIAEWRCFPAVIALRGQGWLAVIEVVLKGGKLDGAGITSRRDRALEIQIAL